MKKKKIKNDIILISAILICLFSALAVFLTIRSVGGYAVVIKNGVETARYPLFKDAEITLTYPESDAYNTLKIENGKASIISASCADGICVEHRAIRYDGETIVCLPNKLVIKIISESEGAVDAIS